PLIELEVTDSAGTVRIVKRAPERAAMTNPVSPDRSPATKPAESAPSLPWDQIAATAATTDVICAPMAGVYYSSPSPGAPPFVTVGTKVEAGQTLCLLEAMKTLTKIEAERAGV